MSLTRHYLGVVVFGVSLAGVPGIANAVLAISNQPTRNVSCSSGVCVATAKAAVLNASDLSSALASSDLAVQSGNRAKDIVLRVAFSWVGGSRLTLDAFHSIAIQKPLAASGPGALTLMTNDGGVGGELSIIAPGRVIFWDMNSSLAIDGTSYTLIGDITTLAADIAANPSGNYALANKYDAIADGIYPSSPIPTSFTGAFEGLGNSILHLSVSDSIFRDSVGLFATIGPGGRVSDLTVLKAQLDSSSDEGAEDMGIIAGVNQGAIENTFVTGSVSNQSLQTTGSSLGGLAGWNAGSISQSAALVSISGDDLNTVGGLVGLNYEGSGIVRSYSNGRVLAGQSAAVGGLVGLNDSPVANSYATAPATGGTGSRIGGLIGTNGDGTVAQAYSTGEVSGGGPSALRGGLIGFDSAAAGSISSAYWDMDTSGIDNPDRGAGKPKDDPGITGLTDAQLRSGLPAGFDPAVWAEDPGINGGYPYLIANPPPQ